MSFSSSTTTTTTATHTLEKYSRSYAQSSASSQQQGAESDWQHFANPVIRLSLDVQKSLAGQIVSVRLRIVWHMNLDNDTSQREIVFEDLDLLSFASLPASTPQQPSHLDHGLPLKAVYRDAIVGIRYLHPRIVPPGSTPVYRRFQIAFISTSDASQFVDTIRNFCPCKGNSAPPAQRAPTMINAATSNRPHITSASVPQHTSLMRGQSYQPARANPYDASAYAPSSGTPARPSAGQNAKAAHSVASSSNLSISSIGVGISSSSPAHPAFGVDASSNRSLSSSSGLGLSSQPSHLFSDPILNLSSCPAPLAAPYDSVPTTAVNARSAALASSDSGRSSLPDSSQVSISSPSDVNMMPPPPPPSSLNVTSSLSLQSAPLPSQVQGSFPSIDARAAQALPSNLSQQASSQPQPGPSQSGPSQSGPSQPGPSQPEQSQSDPTAEAPDARSRFLATLQDAPTIYNLSRYELEQVVSRVIREIDFAKLLEDLDSLWRVKGYLAI